MRKLDTEQFDELIYDDEKTAAVIFHRESCGICRQTISLLKELENKHSGIIFAEVDAEAENELFSRFGYDGVPQVMFFKNGNLTKNLSGRCDREEYIRSISEIA